MRLTNYSAQAYDDLARQMKLTDQLDMVDHLSDLKDRLNKSVKFRLPDNGLLFDFKDADKDPIETIKKYCPLFRLPFPFVALEFMSAYGSDKDWFKVILMAKEIEIDGRLHISLNTLASDSNGVFRSFEMSLAVDVDNGLILCKHETNRASKITDQIKHDFVNKDFTVVISLISALACSNTKMIDDQSPDIKLNISREKKGKTPFYQYKVLTVGSNQNKHSSTQLSKHNSPKMHVRRGHIRRLADKNIWVNSMVVGSQKNGILEKEYKVKYNG